MHKKVIKVALKRTLRESRDVDDLHDRLENLIKGHLDSDTWKMVKPVLRGVSEVLWEEAVQ